MRNFFLDLDPANTDTDRFCDGVIGALDVALTQLQTTCGDGLAHRVCIVDMETTDHSANTFTLTGTDADGKTQVEAIAGPGSGATVESTKYFLTLTSVVPSVTIAATESVDVGFVDEVASPTIRLSPESLATFESVVTGTINYDIETSLRDPNRGADQSAMGWVNDAGWTAKTAATLAALAAARPYARVVINSYTNTAELQFYGYQSAARG